MSITVIADWDIGLSKFSADQLQCFVPSDGRFALSDVVLIIDRHDYHIKGKCNIFVQVEPEAIFLQQDFLIQNSHLYERIYTFNSEVLKSCQNAVFYVYGTTWISPDIYSNVAVEKKQWKASNLAGSKNFMRAKGHRFRCAIHSNQQEIAAATKMPVRFFRSSVQKPALVEIGDEGNNPFLKEKKELFEGFQFAIVIENSQQTNYFTEKLMDCLITKTIPIYYGCPNISDFFDTAGWLIIENDNVQEVVDKIKSLTERHYDQHSASVHKNFETAKKYADFGTNLLTAASSK